jgi:transcriptional regulator with XRE-family HTH domain
VNLDEAFGAVLKEQRKAIGLSQEALALDAELERNFISLLERGKNSPSMRTLFKLCAVLQIAPSDLVRRVELRMIAEAR